MGQLVCQRANTKGRSLKLDLSEHLFCPKQILEREKLLERYMPEQSLAEKLAEAVEDYTEKVLKGLNALTEDEIQEKLEEFMEFFKPEPSECEYTREEAWALFYKMLAKFEEMLRTLADEQHTERLLVTTAEAAAKEENDSIAGLIRAQIVSRSPQPQGQAKPDISRVSTQAVQMMVGRYEQMVPVR